MKVLLVSPAVIASAQNALAVATAVAAVAIFLLGAGALVRSDRRSISALFFIITLAAASWLGSFAMMYASPHAEAALGWARIGHFFGALLPAAVFQFATSIIDRQRHYAPLAIFFWIGCAGVGTMGLLTSLLIPSVRRVSWGYYPVGEPQSGLIILFFSMIILASIHLFWRSYRAAEGKARERAGALLLAFVLGSLGMFDFLPSVGVDLQPVGYIATLAFVIVAAIAVWGFELADITPEYAAGQILETMKSAVVVSDMEGRIRVANGAAERLLGYRTDELRDLHLRRILDPGENVSTGQLIAGMGVVEQAMVWRNAAETDIDVLAVSSFLRDDYGVPVGVVYVASDFTEWKRAEEALRESEQRYRMLFEHHPLPMWVYDFETLAFSAVNDAAVRHYGFSRDEFLAMTIRDIRPGEELPAMQEAIDQIEAKHGPAHFRHRKKDGTVIDVEVTSFEFSSAGRKSRLVIAQDVTERNRDHEALRRSEERYRELFENANDLLYTHDLEGVVTSMNVAGERISGYSREELIGKPILTVLAPEHVERTREAMNRKLRGEATSTFYEVEMISKGGRRIPIELSTRLIHRDGRPIGVQGIGRDVTERKASEARYRLLFERNLAGVYRTSTDGRIIECNESCARIFGYESRDEFLAADAVSFYFDPADRRRIVQLLREHGQLSNFEQRLRRRDGSAVWVLESVTLLDDEVMEGAIIDVTDRKLAQEQLEHQAYHDALTALPNRLLFRDRVVIALAHARRARRSSSVMFLDLDQFKHVNDTLGHTVGDRLLQVIGWRLTECVRAGDTVARMGGDEFTILLADVGDGRSVEAVATKILDAVRQPVLVDEHELRVTTSIGIAMFPADGEDAETLLKAADSAMYRAKDLGRDRYVMTGRGTPAAINRPWPGLSKMPPKSES